MFVEDANLPTNVSLIRKALGENGDGQRFIETVPKHGYRLNQRTTSPVWSQDGREMIVASGDVFSSRLYRIAANLPGQPREIESVGEAGPVLTISHSTGRLTYVRETFDPNIWRLQLGPDRRIVGSPVS